MSSNLFGIGVISENYINNIVGIINNDVFKLIVNVFVWIIEIVLYGE